MPVSGEMPFGCVLSTRPSSVRQLAVGILVAAAAWCVLLLEGPPMAHPPNKLAVCPPDLGLEAWCCAGACGASILPLFFNHQGDGGGGWWGAVLHQPAWWGSSDAATSWSSIVGDRRQRWLSCLCFFRPNGGPPKPCDGGYSSNKPPRWRPFEGFPAAFNSLRLPSGIIPGEKKGGRRRSLCCCGGEEGPDCFQNLLFRVLCANFQDYAVIFVLSGSCLNIVTPPTMD